MKHHNSLIIKEFDKYLAILGLISSLILIYYLNINIGRIIYSLTGVFVFISCTIWILIRKKAFLELSSHQSSTTNLILATSFFIFLLLSVLSIYLRSTLYERPHIYFILTLLMVGIVVLEIIFFSSNVKYVILTQIIIIGLSISWSQLLIFPSLLGIDPWYHQMFTLKIIEEHFIPINYDYSKLPIFHLVIALTSLTINLNYKLATMLSVSLVQIVLNATFIFLFGKFLFNNYKIGLLASLLVIISNQHITMSYWSIPNSFAAIFISIVFYLLLKIKDSKSLHARSISIFLMVIIILTHTVTAMAMAIFLFVSWTSFKIYNKYYCKIGIPTSFTLSIFFIVTMFVWWTFVSNNLKTIANLIDWGFGVDYFIRTPEISRAIVSTSEQLFNNVGVFLYFSISFIGFFYMISKRYGKHHTFAMAIIGITPLALGFFSLISNHSIIEHRWWYFAQILLSLPTALGLTLIRNAIKNRFLSNVLLVTLTIFVSFLMIMSPIANVDNHIFSVETGIRYALTESEIQAVETSSSFWDKSIGVDNYYSIMGWSGYNMNDISKSLYAKNFDENHDELILIREYILKKPFKLYQSPYKLDYNPRQILENNYSKIYDSGLVDGFVKLNKN